MKVEGRGSESFGRARVECSPSLHPPLLHFPPAHPLSSRHLHFHPPSFGRLARPQPCRGRRTPTRHRRRRCPPSLGSWLCSGSRCQRGAGTTGGCGRRCLGPSGCGPPGHIGIYAGQQTPGAKALILSSLSRCRPDGHSPVTEAAGNTGHATCIKRTDKRKGWGAGREKRPSENTVCIFLEEHCPSVPGSVQIIDDQLGLY